jgi:hypothetical protein
MKIRPILKGVANGARDHSLNTSANAFSSEMLDRKHAKKELEIE